MQGSPTLFIIPFRPGLPRALSHYLILGSWDILVPQRSKGNFARFREKSSGAAGCAYLEWIPLPVGVRGSFVTVTKTCARKLRRVNRSDTAKGTIPAVYRNSCIRVFIARVAPEFSFTLSILPAQECSRTPHHP